MRFAGFKFRPTLGPSVAFVCLFVLLLGLGSWQLDRAQEKESLIARKAQRGETEVLNLNRATISTEDRFTLVTVQGRYRDERQWLLDNRVVEGRVGYHVNTLFEFKGPNKDQSVLVNRGWIPVGETREFLPDLPISTSPVILQGRMDRPASVGLKLATGDLDGLAPAVALQHLDIDDLAEALQRDLLPYALVLDAGQPGALRYDWTYVEAMSPEKHRGYAIQWFGLALALLIIYIGTNTKRADRSANDKHAIF